MLYLSGSHLGNTNKISENIIKVNGTYTTGSYLITNNAMNYFVNNIKNYNKEVDVFLAENIQPYFNCFWYYSSFNNTIRRIFLIYKINM